MELGAHVWLRKEDSHWGWVPAVITKKESVMVSGVELINITLNQDRNIEKTMPPPSNGKGGRKSSAYFSQQKEFEVVVTVDPEQLKTADHDDVKLRNLPTSFHLQGEDPEARVVSSPSTHSESGVVGGVDDLIGLTHLHEPAILHALQLRYDANIIYTATGPILIAVNPFKRMDIYGPDQMEKYCTHGEQTSAGTNTSFTTPFKNRRIRGHLPAQQQRSRLPPHVFQTADDAYRAMMRGMENIDLTRNPKAMKRGDSAIVTSLKESPTDQSILVSGESGAGKTVTTKIVLNYFAMLSKRRLQMQRSSPSQQVSPPKKKVVSTEQQVLQSNPILEAFGNARTLRNDNSSRFGKYIDIQFTRNGNLSGAQIETYLLEKVRLIHICPGERNYHVFYQFLAGATHEERKNYLVGNRRLQDFKMLNQSGTFHRRDGVDDANQHKDMLNAMITIGFPQQEVHDLMRLVTGILFSGNMSFTPSKDGESCSLNQDENAMACATLLGITFEGLSSALTAVVMRAGDEIVHKNLNIEEATKASEALIKSIYGAMFDYVVQQVNKGIDQDEAGCSASIGVLDIFGFEAFENNSFEQLCINFTNEALQQQFNKYVFKLEQQEYEKEGIMWKFISFPDNQDVLDLIDKKHEGILRLLDEQCILPKSTDEKFTRYLYGRCDKHPRFKASSAQRVDCRFSIEHYAGDVEYNTESWIEKNKDQLPAAASALLKSSNFEFIQKIKQFVRTEDRGGRGSVVTKSVSSQFSTQLSVLRARIDKTVPHYIRCLKPNDELVPDYFEPKNVVEQLRCGGVLEAVRVSRAGYPTRYPHDVFLARYHVLGDNSDRVPQSPVFSPKSNTEQALDLKRLISRITFDLWFADHQLMMALIEAEKAGQTGNGSFSTFFQHQKKTKTGKIQKLHSGPFAPPFNLVVEHTSMTPDEKHRKKATDPTSAIRERRKDHHVVRPESEEEFLSLDFPSRCAVAGLQLGRTKVFLRREAFDRIEAMRAERFNTAAETIQKIVRGKICRDYYQLMRYAAVVIQSLFRMRLGVKESTMIRYENISRLLQRWWRGCSARLYVSEMIITRGYAAAVIQQAWRRHKHGSAVESQEISEEQLMFAIVALQAACRGHRARVLFEKLKEDSRQQQNISPVRAEPSPSLVKERQITPVSPIEARQMVPAVSETALGALFREIQNENWAMVESILDKSPELAESPDLKTGELVLHKIARQNGAWTLLVDMVLVLFPKALIHRDNMGALPIHHAAAHDNLAALEIIHSAYTQGIKEADKMGRLPIHVAATYDAIDAVKFLLAKDPEGAYTNVYRPHAEAGGGLPLHIACSNHASIGVITALLAENFGSAKKTDENGDLPIHLLLRCGEAVDPVVVKTLLQCFTGSVTRTDMFGDLPLHIAIKHQCRSAVINTVLMHYPEGAGVLNGEGHSPLFLSFKHNADDRTIMGLLNHAPDLATSVDRKTGLLPIQVATENEHSHFIVHSLLKRDLPIDLNEKVRAALVPHHYSWNHIVSNTEDLYHQVVTKILQACTQPQTLALAHVEGPDGRIALAAATPVCKHEIRVMLRLFNTLEVVNQRPAYTNPVSDTQIFYALRFDPPPQANGQFTILHEEKKESNDNDYIEDFDDQSHVSALSRHSIRSTLTSRSQQTIEDRLRYIRKEKGQQVIAKLTSRSDVVERELKIRKDYHLSRHYVPAIISVHHTVQHAAYSEAMAEPGYCITMEGADTTAENLMLDLRRSGKRFPAKALKRIGISLLHMHEHGIIHGDFGTHNIGKFGSRWKLLGVGGSTPIGSDTDPSRGFYHPPESIVVEKKRVPIGNQNIVAYVKPIEADPTYDIWAYGVVIYEAIAGIPLGPYSCRGKRSMTSAEVSKIGLWDQHSVRKALKHIPDEVAQDLLKHLLHHDPKERFSTMRTVLEHPFFSGGSGSVPPDSGNRSDQHVANPNSGGPVRNSSCSVRPSLSRTSSSRSSSTRQNRDSSSSAGQSSGRRYRVDPPDIKVPSEVDSIENRENNVPSVTSSTASNRSGRSGFGAFRKRIASRK